MQAVKFNGDFVPIVYLILCMLWGQETAALSKCAFTYEQNVQ